MNLIKNAFIYKVDLPAIEHLTTHLKELPFEPLGEAMLARSGFVVNEDTAELVTPIEGGLTFTLRHDEKILPMAAVNARARERIAELQKSYGRKLKKKECADIKDAIMLDMARVAFIKTVYVNAFYQRSTGFLLIATSSKSMADRVTGSLVKAVGSVKAQTIYIDNLKNGITTKLQRCIDPDTQSSQFGLFWLGSYVHLNDQEGKKVTYEIDDMTSASEGLHEAIAAGCKVDRIELANEACTFRLTSDFRLASIRFAAGGTDEEFDSAADFWKHNASACMLNVGDIVLKMCELFEYKPPVEAADDNAA